MHILLLVFYRNNVQNINADKVPENMEMGLAMYLKFLSGAGLYSPEYKPRAHALEIFLQWRSIQSFWLKCLVYLYFWRVG